MPKIVNALLISDQKILLARRSVHRRAYPDCWCLPGGHVEDGESNEEALHREMMEEIGVIPTEYRHIAEIINPEDDADPATFHIFTVGRWEGNPTIRDDEHTELRWFALRDAGSLPDLALEEYRPLFAKLRANKS